MSSVGAQIGAYKILDQLGEGGMGTVWRAEHMGIGRKAAVKMLHGEYSHRAEIVQRFFNEARAATQISDPGIVQIFDFGTTPEGYAYIVMELLVGEALDRRLQRLGKLTVHDALRIMRQVSSTLGAAHAQGIVHRDLKPENVYMVRDPEVPGGERAKILDFGIAKLSDNAGIKTQTNAIMGTPMYMSPEQCRGAGGIDARSDVYALGCLMFALITGLPPFVAEGHGELIVMHLTQPAPLMSSRAQHVAPAVDAIAARCLAKNPAERYASGTELAHAIGMLITSLSQPGPGVMAPNTATHQAPTIALSSEQQTTLSGAAAQTPGTMTTQVVTRSKVPLIAGAIAVLGIAGGIGFLAVNGGGDKKTTVASESPTTPTPPAPKPEAPKPEAPKPEAPQPEAPKPEAPKPEAPKPEAPKPEAPVAVEKVSIPITSTPAAQLFVGDEKTARGTTPYTLELEKGGKPVAIKLVAAGYKAQKRTVAPTETNVAVKLVKAVAATTTSGDSDDTMNPFAKKK
ncbi:MAG TPA: protein kinase [Kofleriaceae bacterium]|nr:protein kinase [Kofleriaceae bacterium]